MCKIHTLGAAAILAVFSIASAETLVPVGTYDLDPRLASDWNNGFHPQGIGYDDSAGELLFIQQMTYFVYRTDLTGNIVGQRDTGPIETTPGGGTDPFANHSVSVAADATSYYYADYTCNTSCYDLHVVPKGAGAPMHLSSEVAAYGGYPIDVRAGLLYRTENTVSYDYAPLGTVRISQVGTPDVTQQTLTLAGSVGIADMSVDLDGNCIWVLEYTASASVHRFDLTTGALLQTFPLGLEGREAGLAYGNGRLYYYDWKSPRAVPLLPSTLTVYDVVRSAAVRTVDATPATVSRGGTGYPVSVTVENVGMNTVNVTSVDLSFTGTADRTAEYMVAADPSNPVTIAAGVTALFEFLVDVDLAATSETITIDASFTGADAVTAAAVDDGGADTTDMWDVLTCAPTLCGDCNGDGTLTIIDALVAAQHAASLIVLTPPRFTDCNVLGLVEPDPGALVDVLDALTLAQAAAGLPVVLACC